MCKHRDEELEENNYVGAACRGWWYEDSVPIHEKAKWKEKENANIAVLPINDNSDSQLIHHVFIKDRYNIIRFHLLCQEILLNSTFHYDFPLWVS